MTAATASIDVIVAGAGAGGCAAALAAAETGGSLLLVERNTRFRQSSNTAMSTSMIPAAGSRWQAQAGIDDSPERFLEDIQRKTGGTADPVLARALTDVAPELVSWLADRWDLPLELVTDFSYPGHSRDRCHAVPDRSGATMLSHLVRAVEGQDAIMFATPMELADVIADNSGAVTGAIVRTPDGDEERVEAGAVVLATNGFGANPELVQRHIPEAAVARYHGGDGSTGDALRIGEALGADTAFLDAYQGHGSLAVPHGILLTWAAIMHGGFIVNRQGRRFGDETVGYSEYGPLVQAQPEHDAWVIYDEHIHHTLKSFKDYQDILSVDAVRWANDRDALPDVIPAPADELTRTIEQARSAALGDASDPFERTRWERPLAPPYAVVHVAGALFHTQGGLRVDGVGRVQRAGEAIPGLYAVGGAAHSISGHGASGYLAGNGLLPALGLGYLAGKQAAQR